MGGRCRPAMSVSATHLVILPAFNAGSRLRGVVRDVLAAWHPVLVVDDGSTDATAAVLQELAAEYPALAVLTLPRNSGKGAAVLAGAAWAQARGLTHALVMDADGQHPVDSIAGFMAASAAAPAAMILGRPVFPANMPAERRHGRKLSIGLVHFELLSHAVADPLFGFRVYPLEPLVRVLGPRRGGRRYDFDTEAAVRLAWAGIPPRNLAAPVRYFSRSEGGVSHFHYVRDNLNLAWMHTRLITEFLLLRWPGVLRHRRAWVAAALVVLAALPLVRAAEPDPLVNPAHLLAPGAPGWSDLAADFAAQPDITAAFTEHRQFPFKKEPIELAGESRVSHAHGLSLHYTSPEDRIVILDARGVLVRDAKGEAGPPPDPRASGANDAMFHILQFDFAALEHGFELYGERSGRDWTLALVPRSEAQRKAIGRITVSGTGTAIHRIELRRSARQVIGIDLAAPVPTPFSPADLKRFFR